MAIKSATQKKDPTKTSAAHDTMVPRIDLVNTLMGGTVALRAAAENYLPKYTAESENSYRERLKRSVLVNYFRRSVESLVGKPFSTPIVIGDDVPQPLQDLCEDIDRQGNGLDVFARKSFQDCLVKGMTHILVEYPDTNSEIAGTPLTLADERKLNADPYFVFVPAESILAAYCEYRNGQEVLTHVRIYETETIRDGFDEVVIERVRILEPGTWQLWRKYDKKWQVENSGTTTLDFIPLVSIYFEREEFMVARPPLEDLAHVNIAHFQSSSDQSNILMVTRFPILAGSGLDSDEADQIKIGPRQFLSSVNEHGEYYYVEHTGAAIEAGRLDLAAMEEQMSILGIELLKDSGNTTATAKAIDTAENLSMLQAFSVIFIDGLEKAFSIAARWKGLPSGGSFHINTDFGLKIDDPTDLSSLQFARTNGDISHEQYVRELQRRGTLAEDFDMEADKLLVAEEKQQAMVDAAFEMKLQNESVLPPDNVQ